MLCRHVLTVRISIHVLREEDDGTRNAVPAAKVPFLSTSSARRTTVDGDEWDTYNMISIHVLREEDDGADR